MTLLEAILNQTRCNRRVVISPRPDLAALQAHVIDNDKATSGQHACTLSLLGTCDDPEALVVTVVLRAAAELDGIMPDPYVVKAKP